MPCTAELNRAFPTCILLLNQPRAALATFDVPIGMPTAWIVADGGATGP